MGSPATPVASSDRAGRAAQYGSDHVLERRASGNLGEVTGQRLSVIGQYVKVVVELGQALHYPRKLPDRVVDMVKGSHG